MPGSDNHRAVGAERTFTTDRGATHRKLKLSGIRGQQLYRGRPGGRQKTSPVRTKASRSIVAVVGSQSACLAQSLDRIYKQTAIREG